MATHDYVIDNSTGANVRADINNVLQAILTNNSSSSAPSTTAAYMFWADTTSGTLKIRNSSNNAWVELLQLDGTLTLEDGSASTPGLAFRDDLNTGIFSSAANKINFTTGGTEKFEIGSETIFNENGEDIDFRIEGSSNANLFYVDAGNNRVGIGTSTPGNVFDVSGTISGSNFLLNTSAGTYGVLNDTSIAFFGSASTGIMQFKTNGNAERMRLDSSGRLLLGTTTEGFSSADDLTVANTGTCGITVRSGNTSNGNLYFSDATSGTGEYSGYFEYRHADNSLRIGANATEAMAINSSQNVGIGTSAPTSKLNVVGRLDVDGLQNQNTAEIFANSTSGQSFGLLVNAGSTSADYCANFRDKDAGSIMLLRGDGQIGIGTSTPNRTIEIKKSSPGIRLEELTSGGNKRLEFFVDGSEANIAAPQSSQTIMFSVSGADTMRIARSGSHAEVFINTDSILNNGVLCLKTNGSNGIAIRAGATNSQTHQSFQSPNGIHGTITTDGSNTQYNTSSDYRLKENVTAISDGITRIKNLLPKRFNFKLKPEVTQDGFLAHEVSSVVPEAVSGDKDAVDSNGDVVSQQLDTSKLIPLLVASVQELITKVEALEAA